MNFRSWFENILGLDITNTPYSLKRIKLIALLKKGMDGVKMHDNEVMQMVSLFKDITGQNPHQVADGLPWGQNQSTFYQQLYNALYGKTTVAAPEKITPTNAR